jgi:two-component system, OmpR family, response regulator RegX3
MHLLLVEDDDRIADPLVTGLAREGFTTTRVATAADALAAEEPDLVLLDIGLPDRSGFEVCRELRDRSAVPIIVLTARGEEIDRVLGLELGADDYLVKPFGFRELVARIRAVSRRSSGQLADTGSVGAGNVGEPPSTVHINGLEIDRRTRRVRVGGAEVALTRKEHDLLELLALDPGAVRTRTEILETVWDAHWHGPTKTLDVHVAALRRKLGDPGWIETVRGVGFRLGRPG